MSISSFRFPTDIRFGAQAIQLLPKLLQQAQVKRPLLVTDKALAQQPVCLNTIKLLKANGLEPVVYSDAQGNPVASHVTAGVAQYKQSKADSIVMIGGGCAIDVGKAIALMVAHPGDLFDYEDDKPGARPIDQPIPLTIAIPTTAGTGSEVGGSSVISDDKTHQKVIVWSPRLIPRHVIADPELTVSLPKNLTAATGIDALTHNIEAFLAKNFHPICDGIALEGITLVAQNLQRAMEKPDDLKARGNMLLASMMGAIAFQKGLGVTHSCAHSLSTCYDLHHGLANALMIIPCLKFNAEVVPDRFVRMGKAIGLTGSDSQIIAGFFDWLRDLKTKIGIPSSLSAVNVQITDRLISVAVTDACHGNNPRPCSKEDFARLFKEALAGE
ncbi:iron-containing alcohol dehydrogenase [Oligoflexus tunisiensis]|uniref:iron-containing alcohol dehydrogenase n=1 Tax=Oligoflexus tunisiensis TaxID=708132 RepID=UPI000B064EDE|nr:iron-containing alcohol dehydrogenase [Oligoflexus tunisiensis]